MKDQYGELRSYIEGLEEEHEAGGWDKPAKLYRIHRDDNGYLTSDPVRLEIFHEDPIESIAAMAYVFENVEKVPQGMAMLAFATHGHPTLAYTAIHEAWGHSFATQAEHERYYNTPRNKRPAFADMVGSVECRIVATATTGEGGQVLLTRHRERGSEPTWTDDRPVTEKMMDEERLSSALVRLWRGDQAQLQKTYS